MKDLMTYANKCMELLDNLKIPYGKINQWTINTRAKKRWGLCEQYIGDRVFNIEISSRLLADEVTDVALETTILHELLHSCKGALNHGDTWQYYANKVNRAYGYNIKRCTSATEKGIEVVPEEHKYAVECPKCGKVWYYDRLCKIVKTPNRFFCKKCNEHIVRKF